MMQFKIDGTRQYLYWPITNRGFFSEIMVAMTAALADRRPLVLLISEISLIPPTSAGLFFQPEAYGLVHPLYTIDLHDNRRKITFAHCVLYRWLLGCRPPNKAFGNFWHQDALGLNTPECFQRVLPVLKRSLMATLNMSAALEAAHDFLQKIGIDQHRYHCVHLRAGDKLHVEAQRQPYDKYFQKLNRANDSLPVVVITDDYREFLGFRDFLIGKNYPSPIYTTASKQASGYDQNVMMNTLEKQRTDILSELLTDFMLAAQSQIFVGTFSSNVSRVLYVYRQGVNTYGVDGNFRWIW